jgi:hypothetical protein
MINDFTTIEQTHQLLQAGIDPMTCNVVLYDGIHHLAKEIFIAKAKEGKTLMFPVGSYEKQKEYIKKFQILPVWTSGALMNCIPDSPKQTISLTRGGYDSSIEQDSVDDGYMSEAYFAIYEYEDEERNLMITRTFGGDSYIEALTNMVVAFLTEIKFQIQ